MRPYQHLGQQSFYGQMIGTTCGFNLQKDQLVKLLGIATVNKLFQFDVQLHEQTDRVAMRRY